MQADDGHTTTQHSEVEAQVRSLERMNLAELREFWRGQWGSPPKLRSAELQRLIIAWRIQAATEGGLPRETKPRVNSKSMPRTPAPPVGTQLTMAMAKPACR